MGWELQRALAPLGEVIACGRAQADLENLECLRKLVREVSPQWLVNAAAYTAVDKAESDSEQAHRVNADAVAVLAEECNRLDAWLIHYSTDYVYDGTKTGCYEEDDAPNPSSAYGRTKMAGEQAVITSGCRHLIFRTSWVYASHGANFAKTMLRLAKERDELKIVSDQIGAPTSAELIADITALCLYRIKYDPVTACFATGVYHLAASGETSWHGFAQLVIAEGVKNGIALRTPVEKILPIATADYPLPAKRPANSRLNTQKIINTFGVNLPAWQDHVRRIVSELANNLTEDKK